MPVVDASVVVDWVAPDSDATGSARLLLARLAEHDETVSAPRLMLQEVSNALLTGVRRGRWNGTAADEAFERLRQLPVDVDDVPADLDRAWELSRRYDEHPVHDMVYVALAERLGEPLITADVRLSRKLAARGVVQALDDAGSSTVQPGVVDA